MNLVGALFRVNEITETVVYGIAVWDLVTSDEMKQSKLVIEKTYEFYSDLIQQGKIPMTVDDIELAQFVYYLNDHKKMRDTLNILNDKGVLLLGRFKDGGLERLYSIREWLQRKGYMAMIFDFARPDNLSLTETVVTMAGLSKFIFVDLSGASVPAELQPFSVKSKNRCSRLATPTRYSRIWLTRRGCELLKATMRTLVGLEANLPEMEKLHGERIMQLARRYDKAQ